jgi:F-type H+-transporting ATPase subunit b
MIDLMPNETLFFQMGIFLFTFISLNLLVFKPILRIIERRKALTAGAEKEALVLDEKTQGLIETHRKKMQEARTQGLALKEKFKKEGETEAASLAAKVQGEVEASVENARSEISRESKEAQLVLRKLSRDLSKDMAEKLLGRKVAS